MRFRPFLLPFPAATNRRGFVIEKKGSVFVTKFHRLFQIAVREVFVVFRRTGV
jgi:hypothetical protein